MQNSSEEMQTDQHSAADHPRSVGVFRLQDGKMPYVLILGSGEPAQDLVKRCQQLRRERYKLLGCISLNGSHGAELLGDVPLLGTSAVLRDYIFRNPVDIVLVSTSLSSALSKELLEPILEIGLTVAVPKGVTVSLESSIREKTFARHEAFLGVDTTLLTTVPQRKSYLFAKRVIDLILSATGLIVLAPLLLLIALVIKLSSPKGAVFYPWHVLGKNGKPFVGYKFRTMVPNADQLKQELLCLNEMQGPVFKMRNDPRVTTLGRFLRKYSLDELPQLYSVLKGDMSLVGPRPPSQQEAERFEFWQRRKLSVQPGISCLWQINGRSEIHNFDEWARLDLEYIQNASLLLDLRVIMLTIPAALSGRGAS
jgi:exopolysaccharide biosynthesis polyprenyl glycosylphosphotransferase